MDYKARYEEWLSKLKDDDPLKKQLIDIAGDEKEIEDRFYQDLSFGTAGLRGKVGAGTNRMNFYTVGKATQGIADYIIAHGEEAMKKGGKVTLKFTTAPGGEVVSIAVVSSTTGYAEFDSEIKGAVGRWTFSKVKSGNTTVTIPFTFSE